MTNNIPPAYHVMDDLDRRIINTLQGGFPITDEPFARIAQKLEVAEDMVLQHIQALVEQGILSRFGPLFDREKMGGSVTLAALSAPEDRFDEVAALVNAHSQVAHNYARTHKLNMWFVVSGKNEADIEEILQKISQQTGLKIYNFPKEEEFFIGLKLQV